MEKLLDDMLITRLEFAIVDSETRFKLHVIDAAIMLALFITYVFCMERIFGKIQPGDFVRPLGGLSLYLIYYTGFEFAFSKTPGKFMTHTKVVSKNGGKPSLVRLLVRNASRLIPFDDISYLFNRRGWHDQISGTCVIKEKNV